MNVCSPRPLRGFQRALPESRPGFSLIELLVVTSILVILLAVTVPAFSVLVRTSERSLAEARLTTGLRAARDAALAQGPGRDTAAVFFFDVEPGGVGRVTVAPYVRAGQVDDLDAQNNPVRREVFVPVPGGESTQLPVGTAVRGLALAGAIEPAGDWMSFAFDRYDDPRGAWVFPESSLVDFSDEASGPRRQTFMVRFAGGTGSLVTGPRTPVIVVSPAPTTAAGWRRQAPFDTAPVLSNTNRLERWSASITTTNRFNDATRRRLLGAQSPDTVLASCVSVLAVYDERELASALGVRTDRSTRTVLEFDGTDVSFVAGNVTPARVNDWLWGDSNLDGTIDEDDATGATLLTFDRYSGLATRASVAVN